MAVAVTLLGQPSAFAARPDSPAGLPRGPKFPIRRPRKMQNARVVLADVPNDIIPGFGNAWPCPCDSDGCWPGCFTVASATVLKYWSQKGFPNLWNGDENGTLQHLRDLFPNLLCYGNGDGNGKPGDSGYDAFDVAGGLLQYTRERNYAFTVTPVAEPAFDQIVEEIDAGRPVIGGFGESPWGSHAGAIIGYDTTGGRQVLIVRPNLWHKNDTDLDWGVGYEGFYIIQVVPQGGQGVVNVAPQVTFETVVNDGDPGFSSSGLWQEQPGVGYGGQARSVLTTDPTNLGPTSDTAWARWTPQLPYDGQWEVMAWMPLADQDDTTAHIVTYQVNHAEGMHLVRRSQKDAVQGWISIGVFPFVKGDKGNVYLGNLTGDNQPRRLWADSVRFVWRAPILVRSEEDPTQVFVVQDGRRQRIPDPETLAALRLSESGLRKLTALELEQYPPGDSLPSIFGGWVGQYYNNTVLAPPASALRVEPAANFNWNGAPPAPNMSAIGFSARWTRMMALSDGVYPFVIEAVGGVRLWFDGRLEIDAWDARSIYLRHQQDITTTSGLHRVEIEYVNRDGYGRLSLGNLPPNVPIVDQPPPVGWTMAPTITLRWRDGGDADSSGSARRFYATLTRRGGRWSAGSGWIAGAEWTAPLPADGVYEWRVSATDGTAASDWSAPQVIQVDRTAPWSQMVGAQARAEPVATATPPAAVPPPTPTAPTAYEVPDGSLQAQNDGTGTAPLPAAPEAAVPPPGRPLTGLRLTWWATDTLSGAAAFDLQARERVHAMTIYSPVVILTETTRLAYEVIVSGAEEITQALVLTSLVPYTLSVPVLIFTPAPASDWVTFAVGIANTETVFLGVPGSTYEFRVRAVDAAGNVQGWYDGYSVEAQIDPRAPYRQVYVPMLVR